MTWTAVRPGSGKLIAGLVVMVAGSPLALVVWGLSVADRLPEPVASRWSGGAATGFSSLRSTLVLAAMLPLLLSLPAAVGAVVIRATVLRRCLAGMAGFVPVFSSVLFADSLGAQLDLADPSLASQPDVGFALGMVLGCAVGVGAAWLVPTPRLEQVVATRPPPPDAPRAPGPATWEARLPVSPALVVVGVVATVGMVALGFVVGWAVWVIAVPVTMLVVASGRLQASVAPDVGLAVRTVGGVRLIRVPVEQVVRADVTTVNTLEFGGWGLRVSLGGRIGVITRSGEALQVVRGDGSTIVLTVDDPLPAAALLNRLADEGR